MYPSNYSLPQAEVLANKLGDAQFAPANGKTRSIIKTSFAQKDGASDKLTVTAYSYDTADRVDYVQVFGGDGRVHSVPVPWTEYIPADRTGVMEVKAVGASRDSYERMRSESSLASFVRKFSQNGASAFSDGLIGIPLGASYGREDDEELGRIFGVKAAVAGAAAFAAGIAALESAADMLDEEQAKFGKDGNDRTDGPEGQNGGKK